MTSFLPSEGVSEITFGSICSRYLWKKCFAVTLQVFMLWTKPGLSKCFTCFTKTFANLTTYSRKPGKYNGTIIFEIDIMKNSSPINLNLCQTWLFHNCFGCFFCFDLLWAELRVQSVQQKRIAVLVLTWQKVWILNWVGMSFSWCQSQK